MLEPLIGIVLLGMLWGVVLGTPILLIMALWRWITSPSSPEASENSSDEELDPPAEIEAAIEKMHEFDPEAEIEAEAIRAMQEFDPAAEIEAEAIRAMQEFDPEAEVEAAIARMQEFDPAAEIDNFEDYLIDYSFLEIPYAPEPFLPDAPEPIIGDEVRSKKPNASAYLNILQANRISHLFHFTDRSNIPYIKHHGGLFSWGKLQSMNVTPPRPGGDQLSRQLDQRRHHQDYVRLCFHPNQPMRYIAMRDGRIADAVTLKIDPDLILWESTLFSNVNATANYANIGGTLSDFQKISFDLFRVGRWTGETQKRLFQAEVLVKTHIPLNFILNIDEY
ncbi:MAG: DUF4433 domain-containing protein [Candidatus Marinimicrobia bacterium]|nr:DUF4433 domain-containing protein [Candidatus Neomarinimicrobiota bacterium]